MIKLLVVDDSTFMRKVITEMVSKDPEISVVATAGDGREALEKIRDIKPDVVTMDVIMPLPDGIWALEEIMKQNPTPVIIVSSVAGAKSDIVEEAYALGVIDVVEKPMKPQDMHKISQELILKIKAAARVDKLRLLARMLPSPEVKKVSGIKQRAFSVLVIGSSAGGPIALDEVLPRIPADFPAGIIVSQHMPQQFLESYIQHLAKKCVFPIKIGRNGDLILQKRILFSPGDATLEVARTKKGAVVKISKPDVSIQPDIDTTFETCADTFGDKTICVVLSGMGGYGSEGARKIREAGGRIISEDQSTATAYGMPEAIFSKGMAHCVLPSHQITQAVMNVLAGKKPCEVNKEDLMVKGIILRSALKYLRDKYGDADIDKLQAICSVELKEAVNAGFSINLFYSKKIFFEFYEKCLEMHGADDPKLLEHMGAAEARGVVELYRKSFFLKAIELIHFKNFLPKLMSSFFYGVIGEVSELDVLGRSGSFFLRNATLNQELPQRISRERTIGWVHELFRMLLNIGSLRVTPQNGQDEKGPYIKFSIKWEG